MGISIFAVLESEGAASITQMPPTDPSIAYQQLIDKVGQDSARRIAVSCYHTALLATVDHAKKFPRGPSASFKEDRITPANTDLLSVADVTIASQYANVTFDQLKDNQLMKIVVMSDGKARPNHKAMDGFVFKMGHAISKNDNVWPPYGVGCRCRAVPVDSGNPKPFLPSGGGNDKGFKGGPNDPYRSDATRTKSAITASIGLDFVDQRGLSDLGDQIVDLAVYKALDAELDAMEEDWKEAHHGLDYDTHVDYAYWDGILSDDDPKKEVPGLFWGTQLPYFAPEYYGVSRNVMKKNPSGLWTPYGMRTNELMALRGYTFGVDGYVNQTMRPWMAQSTIPNKTTMSPYAKSMASALQYMPKYAGSTYRGCPMPPGLADTYKVGAKFADPAFVSTTLSFDVAYNFSWPDWDSDDVSCMFIIKSKTGRNIAPFSIFPGEAEILFPPGASFKVTEVEVYNSWGDRTIYLEEV